MRAKKPKNDSSWVENGEILKINKSSQIICQNEALDYIFSKIIVRRSLRVIKGQKFLKTVDKGQILERTKGCQIIHQNEAFYVSFSKIVLMKSLSLVKCQTYYLERSERLKGSLSTKYLDRSERLKRF